MALYEELTVGKLIIENDLTVESGGTVTGSFAGSDLTGAITSTGNATILGTASFTSANLRGALTDETGTGVAVFATSPTLVTPVLGTPTSGTLTNCTGLPLAAVVKPGTSVTGITTDTALKSLLTVLAAQGFIVDNTTAA
jgi:hypothetical protein